jgi:hypothetical protein
LLYVDSLPELLPVSVGLWQAALPGRSV